VNRVKRSLSSTRSVDAAADDEDDEFDCNERVEDGAECARGGSSDDGKDGINLRIVCLCWECRIISFNTKSSLRPGLPRQEAEVPEEKSASSSL